MNMVAYFTPSQFSSYKMGVMFSRLCVGISNFSQDFDCIVVSMYVFVVDQHTMNYSSQDFKKCVHLNLASGRHAHILYMLK